MNIDETDIIGGNDMNIIVGMTIIELNIIASLDRA